MHRQSLVAYAEPLQSTEAPTPVPQGTEVLLRVSHCGVCHSDIHLQDGYFDLGGGNKLDVQAGRKLPFTLGHEIAGTVEAVGPEAKGVATGTRYAAYPWIGCGKCGLCARGDEHLCNAPRALGITVDGGYATHCMVPHPRYLLDVAGIDPAFAGALMCSGLTGYSAVKKAIAFQKAGPILIVGLGGVGMMGLSFAQAMFKQPITVADLSPAARETALKNGAAAAYDPAEPDVVKRMLKESDGGFDGVVDFAGNEKSMAFAVSTVARGGKIVVSGLMGGNFSLPMVQWVYKRMTIEGFMVGTLAEGQELMALARAGKIKPTPMKEEPMADVQKWIDELRAGKVVGRIVLKN